MNFTGILVVFGTIALLALVARIISIFNQSKTTLDWFLYLLSLVGMSLAFFLVLDIQLILLLGSILVVWGVAYGPLSWGENNLTPFWNYFLISLSFIYFLLWIWLTGHKKFYSPFSLLEKKEERSSSKSFFSWVKWKWAKSGLNWVKSILNWVESILKVGLGFLIPLLIIVGLVLLGITCFAALTAALNDSGNITFAPVIEKKGMDHLMNFYAWHFCDLIPQIKVAETLNLEDPLKYTDDGVGWLLLLFKSLMAYIVIARFYSWNKWMKKSRKGKGTLLTTEV